MQLGHIEIFVRDPLQSKIFYEQLLGFAEVVVKGRFVWLETGGMEVLLRPTASCKTAPKGYGDSKMALVLYTSQLPQAVERIRAAGVAMHKGDDENCWYFADPDGNWLQLVNPENH